MAINKMFFHTIVLLTLLFLVGAPAQASKIFCWQNDAEIEECGSYVPQRFVKKGYKIKNEKGIIINEVAPEISPEKRQQLEERERVLREARERAEQQAAEDKKILDTFPTERDIEIQRDDKLTAIDAAINVNDKQIKFYEKNLEETQKVLSLTRGKEQEEKAKMRDQISVLEQQVEKFKRLKEDKEQEKIDIKKEYEEKIERYRQIKARQASGEAAAALLQMNSKLASTKGFRGLEIGQSFSQTLGLQLMRSEGDLLYYHKYKEDLTLENIALSNIDYVFFQNQLISIRIRWKKTKDNNEARIFLERVFGPPSNASQESAIRWHGKYITIIYRPNWRIIELLNPKYELLLQKALF